MISVILYGRNDAHGYNLHKRGALSLNCIAEVLTDPADEIIFVDYNSPDEFPTFPEAIADTLTERAKRLLRVLRVRPKHHERFREQTSLLALEPVARNVAVRRSRPDNRWLLSTNTDMIFVPRRETSLSSIVANLPDAYYHLPRFELPESLWETLDRAKPAESIAQIERWGWEFHLNEIASLQYPETYYDAPGDFQLMLRADVWKIQGFDETMLLGWHVDSNIAKRLALAGRERKEIVEHVFGYHCDHYRSLTALHSQHGQRNDVQAFFEDVIEAELPAQHEVWGLAGEEIEESKVGADGTRYVAALRSTIPLPMSEPTTFAWTGDVAERYDYSVDHVLPFLEASIASYGRETVLGWFGIEKSLLWRFAASWATMGFSHRILVADQSAWLGPELPATCVWADTDALEARPSVYVFDFGRSAPEEEAASAQTRRELTLSAFRAMVEAEQRRLGNDGNISKRFIGVNTIVTHEVAQAFEGRIAMSFIPNATHLKQGVVLLAPRAFATSSDMDCLDLLLFGTAGRVGALPNQRQGRAIHATPGIAGPLAYGPYLALGPGRYEALFEFFSERSDRHAFNIDVATDQGRRILARRSVKPHAEVRGYDAALAQKPGPLTCVLPFDVGASSTSNGEDAVEFRVFSPGTINFCLAGLRVRRIAER